LADGIVAIKGRAVGSKRMFGTGGQKMQTAAMAWRLAGPALAIAAQLLLAAPFLIVATPAQAQFFNWPWWGQQPQRPAPNLPWRGEQQQRSQQPVDASKAPPPSRKAEPAAKTVVVMGDSMADWLAYGLEDLFAETSELGVVRKHRTYSGLIRAESKKEFDWPQGAKEILAAEKADFVVMMIGMNDRQSIRDRIPRANPKQPQPGAQPAQAPPPPGQPVQIAPQAGPPSQAADQEATEGQPAAEPPRVPAAPDPAQPTVSVTYEFRSEKWGEAYGKRIDETIAALKSKGVSVIWVGLPAIRGPKSTADMAYLNEIYRGHAERAGAVYVDIWDGFVDENGVFTTFGPDFEGQTRRLRAADGVHFTKPGARKLAHYVEREIRRVMANRGAPMALPAPEEPPPQAGRPGAPAARPVAGPVVPLTAPPSAPEGLLGAGAVRAPMVDPNANRILVKGEPLPSISGRADDFAWPRPAAPQPEPEPPATPSSPKAAPASAAPAAKPAAPPAPPAKKHTPAAAAAAETSRRPLPLSEDAARGESARRRPPQDTAPRPPAPLSPVQ
jgi:uncharacterized protein